MFQGMHYVYEVYKEMSFSKAARNLFISQPSLSAAVKKAEKQIGFPIFDRSSNHIQLTELGKEYIRSIEIIIYRFLLCSQSQNELEVQNGKMEARENW